MRTVKMLETTPGAANGYDIVKYEEGETYLMGDDLAKNFVEDQKVAEYMDAPDADDDGGWQDEEEDDDGGDDGDDKEEEVKKPTDNKDAKGAPENKSSKKDIKSKRTKSK